MKCIAYKQLVRGSLLGFADLQLDNGLILLSCSHHTSNGKQWVNPPSRPQLDAARQVMTDAAGITRYAPVVAFADKAIRYRWSDAAVAAVTEHLSADSKAPAVAGAMSSSNKTSESTRTRGLYAS